MTRENRPQRKEPGILVPFLMIVAVLVVAALFRLGGEKPQEPVKEETPAVTTNDSRVQATIEEPQIQFPVPQEAETEESASTQPQKEVQPAPVPGESDALIEEEFRRLYDEQKFGGLFLLKNIIRNIVVTIDNMTGPKLPQKYSFTKPPVGQFLTVKDAAGSAFIDPKNYGRYIPYADLAESVDIHWAVAFYVRHYALFQQAYRDLGYPDRYFNDRLVQVLDHLLAAPEVRVPIRLVRPKVFYQFVDPELEALSAGQKIMVRIGPDNAARVKARIVELRQEVTTLKKKK